MSSRSSQADRVIAASLGMQLEDFRSKFSPWKIHQPRRKKSGGMAETRVGPNPLQQRVINRDGMFCRYCGVGVELRGKGWTAFSLDHVMPRSRGGSGSLDNLVVACVACNNRKGDATPEEWGVPLMAAPSDPCIDLRAYGVTSSRGAEDG